MEPRRSSTEAEARAVGLQVGIDRDTVPFDVDQFRKGMNVQLESGRRSPETDGPEMIASSRQRSRSPRREAHAGHAAYHRDPRNEEVGK